MRQLFKTALCLLTIIFLVSCQKPEVVVVTREIITNLTMNITATPEPTNEPSLLGGGGQYIAFTTESDDGHWGVLLLDPITKESQTLTTTKIDSSPRYSPGILQWSPDGAKIAFIAPGEGIDNIFLVDPESGETTRLLESLLKITAFHWSPSGSEIAFLGAKLGESEGSLFKINIDGSNQEEIATRDDFRILIAPIVDWPKEDNLLVSAHVWADNEPFLRKVQLFQVNQTNGELRRVSDERFDYIGADFSPDASHILFYSHDEENNLDLFLMNADGNKLQQLADFSVADPAWSPDSKQITYAYNGSISTINVREGTAVAIVSMYDTRAPAWSPDGEWIVFAGKSEENSYFQLYMVHSDGTELTLLTNTEQHHDLPVWQP